MNSALYNFALFFKKTCNYLGFRLNIKIQDNKGNIFITDWLKNSYKLYLNKKPDKEALEEFHNAIALLYLNFTKLRRSLGI